MVNSRALLPTKNIIVQSHLQIKQSKTVVSLNLRNFIAIAVGLSIVGPFSASAGVRKQFRL